MDTLFFQVDMKALAYMNEEDMKSLGIPMVLQDLLVFESFCIEFSIASLLPFFLSQLGDMLILCSKRFFFG